MILAGKVFAIYPNNFLVSLIVNGSGNVIVDFYTKTCGPCRALHPVLEEISNEFRNLTVTKVEVTQNPDLSQMFGVMSVPTVIFMKDSKVKHVSQGFSTKENFKLLVRKFYQ